MSGLQEDELCLIDSGITSLDEISVHRNLRSLDLHCNQIVRIENLLQAERLVNLDLSSNLIRKIEGLTALINLKSLNLSANQIRRVEGLRTLVSLVQIDLSYNEIESVDGFLETSGSLYRLAHVKLQGNVLDSVQHVTHCLSKCAGLHSLVLSDGANTNPLCDRSNYEKLVFSCIPQLRSLNGKNRQGRQVVGNNIPNLPELDRYLDILSSSDFSGSVPLVTPKIDAVLSAHQKRQASNSTELTPATLTSDVDTSRQESSDTGQNQSSKDRLEHSLYEKRLEMLEQKLAGLQQSMTSSKVTSPEEGGKRFVAKRDIDETDESDDDTSSKRGNRKSGAVARSKVKSTQRDRSSKSFAAQSANRISSKNSARNLEASQGGSQVDRQRLDDLETMCVELMKDLEAERVEHWKTQQAARTIADRLAQEESETKEGHSREVAAEEIRNRLKKSLSEEREEKVKLQAEIEVLQEQLQEEEQKFKVLEKSEGELRRTLRTQEETAVKMEQEYLKRKAELGKKVQEFQLKAAAMAREVELVKVEAKDRNDKVHQLQELLANREQAHALELAQRVHTGSKEFRELVSKEAQTLEKKHSFELKQLQTAVESQKNEYAKLEDEFREALIIEEERFRELQTAYEKLNLECERGKKRVSLTEETIKKLNELIREQNTRLNESSKLKHKVHELESRLAEKDMKKAAIESLKQENLELVSQVNGLKSVIDGLMSDKKQTLSLAQEHGRLEAKVEEVEKELFAVKKQLADEKDLVRIKSKIIDDQNETVKKLKNMIAEFDGQLKKEQNDLLAIQIELKKDIDEKSCENQELRQELSHLRKRKDELKATNAELEILLQDARETHEKDQKKYTSAIDNLEKQLQSAVLERNENRKKLAEEKQLVAENQSVATKRMREMDDAFRKQLDLKEESHQQKVDCLLREKQAELEAAFEQKILDLENEMREILREKEEVEYKYDNLRKCLQKISHGQFT